MFNLKIEAIYNNESYRRTFLIKLAENNNPEEDLFSASC